ncbi:MAG: tetratricopeptide repeat protein [Edaphocola sp.]
MFNEDSWNDDDSGLTDDLLRDYEAIKNGTSSRFLDLEDYEYIVEYFFQNSNETEALQACEIALNYFPYATSILFSKAEILFQAQKHGQALQVLDALDKMDERHLDSVLLRSDVLLAEFKYRQAAHLLEQKSEVFEGKDKIELLLELTDVYDECENFDAVFDVLKKILSMDARNEEALHKISFWADFAGKQEESIAIHNEIIEQDPYNALAWFNLGAALQGLKQHEAAIDAYEYCVAIDEKFEFAYRNMADAYMRLHWYDRAIESLEKNLELGKPEDVIFEAMGHCFEKQKNFDRARFYYRQAVKLNPADDGIFYRIGETYSREKDWEKAIKAYSVALNLNKDNAAYSLAVGHCLLEMELYNDAVVCYENAIRLKPNNKGNWVALIKALYIAGDAETALEQIEMAELMVGNKADFDYYRAASLFAQGKSKEALLSLEGALAQAPSKLKLITELDPDLLQRKAVAELVARHKRSNKK